MSGPSEGLTLREIGARVGMSQRAMRAWLKAGLIPHVPFRGPATRYGSDALARAQRVRQLRAERLDFEQIRRRLAVEEAAEAKARAEAAAESIASASLAAGGGDTWQRIVLLPGMELHVRTDGGALLQRLAAEIRARYGVAGNPEAGAGA